MMGILDQFRNEDDAADDDEITDGGDGGGGSDDPFGDDLGGLDDFDDFDDGGGFDDVGDDDDASTGELRNRVDELENEVASLSSTVNTVRSENEEISETVEDIEENVRKLLDIYEMVTRGVNPFVDDVSNEADFGTGSLGLFEDDGGGQEEEDLDSSVADADAEDFFDDDFDDGGEMDAGGAAAADAGGDPAMGGDGSDDDSGKSFSELKEEYEQGEAGWDGDGAVGEEEFGDDELGGADGEFDDGTADEFDDGTADEFDDGTADEFDDQGWTGETDDGFGGEQVDGAASNGEPGDAGGEAGPPASDADPAGDAERAVDGSARDATTAPERTETGDLQFAENTLSDSTTMGSKPYVTDLPDGYVSDLIVMEWMEFLVDEADTEDAARAVRYYGAIEWIDEPVEDRLLTFLRGFDEVEAVEGEPTPSGLTMAHHAQSLQYISRLASATSEMVVLNEWLSEGGDAGGIQR